MAFGNYVVRAVGHKDKTKWVTEIAPTAAKARVIAKRLARSKLGTYPPEVCIFDLKRWGRRRPVCIQMTNLVGKYVKNKIRRTLPSFR